MSRMPSFFRQGGRIKAPRPDQPVQSAGDALAYFETVGSTVREDGDTYVMDHRSYSHGGVTAEGLVHIANEDARWYPAAKG